MDCARIGQNCEVLPTDIDSPQPLPPASARSKLLTVLGEFAFPDDEPVWTTTLIRVLNGLGVETHAARQAIARAAAAGWVDAERQGRSARWRLRPEGRQVVEEGLRRAASMLEPQSPWDERWLVLLISIPQNDRTTRKRLYGGLTWLRMGNPTPGVWLTPHVDEVDELRSLVARFGLTDNAISFVGHTDNVGLSNEQIVGKAWNLSELAESYRLLLARYADHRPAAGDDILLSYLTLRNLQQRFLRLDPQLPPELLPDWIGHEGAELFRTRHDQWSTQARQRWAELARES